MFYPFPRARAAAAPSAPSRCAAAHEPAPAPGASLAVPSRPQPHEAAPPQTQLELSDDLVAAFAAMEQRRTARQTPRGKRRGAAGVAALPEQEAVAARAVQAERRREAQQKQHLYGARLGEVHALEAALNMPFDRIRFAQDPPLWPSVPLR